MKTLLLMALLMGSYSVSLYAQDEGETISIDESEMPAETMEVPSTYEEGASEPAMPMDDSSSEDSGDYEVIE